MVILDFGSQVTQLIARRFRELGVYSELLPYHASIEKIRELKPVGLVLSGGPQSVRDPQAPRRDLKELKEIAPILAICYGMQLLADQFGGKVVRAQDGEYGLNFVEWESQAMGDLPLRQKVWMSHGDVVETAPQGFRVVGVSAGNHIAAIQSEKIWGVQFHPEVAHTEKGVEILRSFAFDLCKAQVTWGAVHIVDHLVEEIQKRVGSTDQVLCALSGGVDSTVMGALLTKALGSERVHCRFVNNGLLRKDEYEEVLANYKYLGFNVKGIDGADRFLNELQDVVDPEQKRKIIGRVFIELFEQDTQKLSVNWLAQGTLYPDVIESVSPRGESVTIKSHHNVGGLPAMMKLKLIEPLRELFKDEVRAVGKELGLPHEILWRHPFPGPGLAIRIIGAVHRSDLELLRSVDEIYLRALKEEKLYDQIWQAFSVLLPIQTVGVQGDARTYERVVALRAVTSSDAMTADWFEFPPNFLRKVSNLITNQVKGVNRVVYDITSKPPGTIEWE